MVPAGFEPTIPRVWGESYNNEATAGLFKTTAVDTSQWAFPISAVVDKRENSVIEHSNPLSGNTRVGVSSLSKADFGQLLDGFRKNELCRTYF